jgi:hypothetical protein
LSQLGIYRLRWLFLATASTVSMLSVAVTMAVVVRIVEHSVVGLQRW